MQLFTNHNMATKISRGSCVVRFYCPLSCWISFVFHGLLSCYTTSIATGCTPPPQMPRNNRKSIWPPRRMAQQGKHRVCVRLDCYYPLRRKPCASKNDTVTTNDIVASKHSGTVLDRAGRHTNPVGVPRTNDEDHSRTTEFGSTKFFDQPRFVDELVSLQRIFSSPKVIPNHIFMLIR